MPILMPNQKQNLAHQKTFLNTSKNSVGNNADAGLLDNNNCANSNVYINVEEKFNFDENMTSKDNNNLYKDDFVTNIKKLFQQI